MYEWVEVLRRAAKAARPGVPSEEVRRAETEGGIPFPEELAALYQSMDGGAFLGEVLLFPLRAPEGQPSVLEKTRLKLVGLPAAGVWRFGHKQPRHHLFTARKSAMLEQGDCGPLPEWVEELGAEDWLYGAWDVENRELRLFRSLPELLAELVSPTEARWGLGERTFARAMSALEGALHALGVDPEFLRAALNEKAAERLREKLRRESAPALMAPPLRGAPARKTAAKKAPARKVVKKTAAKKASAKKTPTKKVVPKQVAAKRSSVRKGAARKAPSSKRGGTTRGRR